MTRGGRWWLKPLLAGLAAVVWLAILACAAFFVLLYVSCRFYGRCL